MRRGLPRNSRKHTCTLGTMQQTSSWLAQHFRFERNQTHAFDGHVLSQHLHRDQAGMIWRSEKVHAEFVEDSMATERMSWKKIRMFSMRPAEVPKSCMLVCCVQEVQPNLSPSPTNCPQLRRLLFFLQKPLLSCFSIALTRIVRRKVGTVTIPCHPRQSFAAKPQLPQAV